MPSYAEAITKAGGIPLLIPLGLDEEDLYTILGRVDGLLLPGGGDIDPALYKGAVDVPLWGIDRERDRTELLLCQIAVDLGVPFLAICRGLQLFNVALGSALIEDIASMKHDAIDHDLPDYQPRNFLAHSVTVLHDSALFQHLRSESCKVNSIHHQAIRTLAPRLNATALAPDGIIEAAELPGHPFGLGVQWHPENLVDDDPAMLSLFNGLVTAARFHRLNSETTFNSTTALQPDS